MISLAEMYSAELLDHFEHPRHAGEILCPDLVTEIENPACGDVLRLTAKVRDGKISEIRFRAKGCVPAMACASALVEMAHGKTFADLRQLRRDQVMAAVGGVPPASGHAAQLALDALTALLRQTGD